MLSPVILLLCTEENLRMHIPKLLECTTVYEEVLATVGCNTTNKKKEVLQRNGALQKKERTKKKTEDSNVYGERFSCKSKSEPPPPPRGG